MVEIMASAEHDGHTVEVKRDQPLSVGYGMPFTYIHVDGQFMGEVTGGRREDDGSLTSRFRVYHDGYGHISLSPNGVDLLDNLEQVAERYVEAYRKRYPYAR